MQDLLHARIVSELLYLRLPVLIFASEALFRDLTRIKVHNLCVIEFVPLAFFILGLLSILDECIVMASFRCAVVHHDAFKLVLEILIRHGSIKQDSLV